MTSYAIHIPDGGTSEYAGYEFSSVAEIGGVLYAVRSDGLYKIDGESDAGVEIGASVGLGYVGDDKLGNLRNIYLEVNSEDKVVAVVPTEQGVFEYPARRFSEDQRMQRVDLGRGLRANKYYVFIRNAAGAAFEVFDVIYNRFTGTRRI